MVGIIYKTGSVTEQEHHFPNKGNHSSAPKNVGFDRNALGR